VTRTADPPFLFARAGASPRSWPDLRRVQRREVVESFQRFLKPSLGRAAARQVEPGAGADASASRGYSRPSDLAEKYHGCQPRVAHSICAVPALWRVLKNLAHSHPSKLQALT
jgi:hypothetical protein